VCQHVGVIATRFFECIGENRQAVERPLGVDAGRERNGGFGAPSRIERDRLKRVAEDAAEEVGLGTCDLQPLVIFLPLTTTEQFVKLLLLPTADHCGPDYILHSMPRAEWVAVGRIFCSV